MNEGPDYEVTRRAAAAVTRRHSFLTLGGAALMAAVAAPATAEAGKAAKKAKKRCKRQKGQCRTSVEEFCGSNAPCLESLLQCCEPLATCNAGASTDCFINFLSN